MRVLLVTTDLTGLGGVQYAGRVLARVLRDVAGPAGELVVASLRDGVADLRAALADCRVYGGTGSRVRTGLTIFRLLRRESWDLVVVGHLNLASLVLAAGSARRLPLLAFIHGTDGWEPVGGLRRRGLRRAGRILFHSQHTRERSQAANPWLKDMPSAVCPLALMETDAGPAPPRRIDGSYALAIGRMAAAERYKGYEEMIRVWPAVQRERPGLRLVLVGDGDDRPRLEQIARDVRADVQFTGRVDDAARDAYLQACRCFCLPSRGEGFGLVYLEAMRAGKPVLTSNCDSGREVIADGETGRAVDPQAPDELLRGILDVSGPRAEEMGRAGLARFRERFTYERYRERLAGHVEAVRLAALVAAP